MTGLDTGRNAVLKYRFNMYNLNLDTGTGDHNQLPMVRGYCYAAFDLGILIKEPLVTAKGCVENTFYAELEVQDLSKIVAIDNAMLRQFKGIRVDGPV